MVALPPTTSIARVFFTLVGLALAVYVVYLVRDVVALLAISVFTALALGPAVNFFDRRLPRPGAILVVYLFVLLGIVGVGLLVVPPIASEVKGLSRDVPGYFKDLRRNDQFRTYDNRYGITKKLEAEAVKLPSRLGDAAGALKDVTVGVFAGATKLLIVLTVVFLLLLDGPRFVAFGLRLGGPAREARYRSVAVDIYRAVSGYVAGNLVISLIAGTVTYVTLTILGVPFAVPLAVLMAFLDLIPLIGATIGGIVIGLITLFNDFPTSTIVWVIVLIVYQQVENNLLQPFVYKRTVAVPALGVIVAVLIGSSLLGVLGALLAIPVAAAVEIVLREWWHRRGEGLQGEPPAGRVPQPAK